MNDYPMKHAPGPGATEREQLRWAQQEAVRLNQGKDRLNEMNAGLERKVTELAHLNNQLEVDLAAARRQVEAFRKRVEQYRQRVSVKVNEVAQLRRDNEALRAELALANRGQSRFSDAATVYGWPMVSQERYDRVKKIADQLAEEKRVAEVELSRLQSKPVLEREQRKTIGVLMNEKAILKEELRLKQRTIWKQGNRVKQLREARNLWRDRAQGHSAELRTTREQLAIYKSSVSRQNLVPAEHVAEAERKLMKRIKKAMKGKA